MRMVLILLVLAAATPVAAQVPPAPNPYGAPYVPYVGGAPAAIADQHRYETERLRTQAQAGAALAASQQTETQSRLRDLEAARQAATPPPPTGSTRPLYSPEQERALRQATAARGQAAAQGFGQIDAWLDRKP
ncbi:MAG: hypothetical protein J0J08_10785 [Brevundimonas sp.]|nr:hypothetical protein [Brevundimonas sp.]